MSDLVNIPDEHLEHGQLTRMCREEPQWAANQVRGLRTLLALLKCESVAEAEGMILALQQSLEDLALLVAANQASNPPEDDEGHWERM